MKKFEYKQIEYNKFPNETDLNSCGEEGWEFVTIHRYKKRFFDSVLVSYTEEIYLATFKREK